MPVVEAVGLVTERPEELDAVLITRHLDYSLPYRALFSGHAIPDLRTHLLNGLAELLARLHLRGFFWGDCSLSNTLFRRDAGALSAYLVDAETGELHGQLSEGQRRYDIEIAQTNVVGELLDVDAEVGLPAGPRSRRDRRRVSWRATTALWSELTREETFGAERALPDRRAPAPAERPRVRRRGDRARRGAGGLSPAPRSARRRAGPSPPSPAAPDRARRPGEPGPADAERHRALPRGARARGEAVAPESVVAARWRDEVFEPTVAAVPEHLRGRLPAAEVFHQVLEHRWFLSEQAKKDVGIEEAVRAYVESELPKLPPERIVLADPED